MELPERPLERQTEQYARLLLEWHVTHGLAEFHRRFDQSGDRYAASLARFRDSELADDAVQRDLAGEQISGAWEWAYGEPLPHPVEVPEDQPAPHTLGELALLLDELLFRHQPARDGRKKVRFRSEEDLLRQAEAFYGPWIGPDQQGSGGLAFLLSCSLERAARRGSGEVELLSPEILGVAPAPAGREADVLAAAAGDWLLIEEVTGESG